MPSVFFGYLPKKKGATKLAVDTPAGTLEPVEPSSFKIYAHPKAFSPVYSMVTPYLGHLLCALSRPKFSFLPFSSDGDIVEPPHDRLPFRNQNFAFAITKGKALSDTHNNHLESLLFTSMKYQDRVVWLKEEMDKDEFKELASMDLPWDDTGAVPQRYLNPSAFASYHSLISVTTRVCELFHRLTMAYDSPPKIAAKALEMEGGKNTQLYDLDPDVPAGPTSPPLKFTEGAAGSIGQVTKLMYQMVSHHGVNQLCPNTSSAAVNPFDNTMESYIESGETSPLMSPGKIFKFEPKLALPDTNLISDVLGRRFLTSLGGSRMEQFENLRELKAGLGALRLTEVGDELTHLYKCVDLAIEGQVGCVPFFSGNFYEGCVIAGGFGAEFSIGDHTSGFHSLSDLKDEFLTASSHGQSLALIASKFPVSLREDVLAITDMRRLREFCLTAALTSDDRDYVIQKAANLRFSQQIWALSPVMIKRSLALIADLPGLLDASYPISRLCLFSKDPVMIALSVFGEKSAPSWNIPNGALQKISSSNPPSIPQSVKQGSGSKGTVNDASWVMEVRRTDLMSAVEDFRVMAASQGYRTLPSVQARKQGYQVFSRERMGEFWSEMRAAYRQVDPSMPFDELESSLKRKGGEGGMGQSAGVSPPRAKKLKF